MRLDFRNIGKGLEAIAGAKQARDLAQESARYDVTQGAYGPGLQENIQQLQGLREQDPAQAPAYDQAIAELTRRQGLTAPDYSVASGAQDYGTRQEARQAAAPARAEGLAGVYRRYGDVAQADALEARAFEQQRGIAREARDVAREGRDVQAFDTQQAAAQRQGLLTEGQIREMDRNQARTKKLDDVDADVAQWQSSRLLDPNTNEPRQPTMDDNIAALQYRATALQKAGLAKEATDSLRDYQGFAVNQIKLDETQRNSQLGAVAAAIAAGDLGPAVAFYDRYVLDGAKVTGMKTDPKTGAITVSRTRDDGGKLPDKVIKGGANELLASLNSFRDPMSLYNFSQNEFTNNLKLEDLALRKRSEARQATQDKTSPLEKNLAALKRLGVSVSPEEVKSMAGLKAPTLSPEAATQIEIITASLKDNSTPANIEAARTAVSDIFRGEGLKQRNTTIVNGLRTAAGRNDLSSAVKQLQDAGVANETIVGLARQAGVPIPAELLPPAPPPQTGLNTGAPRQPIQLLAPFNAIGDLRRRMQQEQQAIDESRGF
jgi:hypothetical protein